MTNDFKTEYLLEADEFEKPTYGRPNYGDVEAKDEEIDSDEKFSVDSYDTDEMSDSPDEMPADYSEDAEMPEGEGDMSEPEVASMDTNEIFTIVSDFFPGVDEEKIKAWIDNVVQTDSIDNESDFLESFEDAKAMKDSFESFQSGDSEEESEDEESEKEEESEEKSETPDEEESEEKDDEKKEEPIEESKKPRIRKPIVEAYSSNLSANIQTLMKMRNECDDAEVKAKYDAVIETLKTKLREPAQTVDTHKAPAKPMQESIRDRIKKRLAK